MLVKACLFIFLCLQLVDAKKTKVLSESSPILDYEVGTKTDLTRAVIEYDNTVQLGKDNKVIVKAYRNLGVAKIYMNVTNACQRDTYSNCIELASRVKIIASTTTVLLTNKGGGVYEGHYTVRASRMGSFNLVFFTLEAGLIGHVYKNTNIRGIPAKTVFDRTINHDWHSNSVYGVQKDNVGIRWKGRLIVPESRTYQFHLEFDDVFRFFVNGVMKANFNVKSGGFSRNFQFYMNRGVHEIVIEFADFTRDARIKLYWKHPASSTFAIIPERYFRSMDSVVISKPIEATCFVGHFLDITANQCKQCSPGMCQYKAGQTSCEPCKMPMLPKSTDAPKYY